jgi:hypothetical protein
MSNTSKFLVLFKHPITQSIESFTVTAESMEHAQTLITEKGTNCNLFDELSLVSVGLSRYSIFPASPISGTDMSAIGEAYFQRAVTMGYQVNKLPVELCEDDISRVESYSQWLHRARIRRGCKIGAGKNIPFTPCRIVA